MTMTMDCPKCWGKNKTCVRCGGDGKCPDVQLSPHFRLSELLASNTARAKGLDNDPSPEVLANLKALCVNVLEPIRAKVGPLKINSGYRSDPVNDAVGGSKTSAHSYGLAADLHPAHGCRRLMNDIIASGVKLDQVIFERTWVHVGYLHPKTKAQRNDKLSMFVVGGKTTYEPYNANDARIA
jgi:hypothetical protein